MSRATVSLRTDPGILYSRLAEVADTVAPVSLAQSPDPAGYRLVAGPVEAEDLRQVIMRFLGEVAEEEEEWAVSSCKGSEVAE